MGCPTNSASSPGNCTNPFPTAADARSNPACKAVVFDEICAIQKQLLSAITSCSTSLTIDSGTPLTTTQGIIGVTMTAGGANNFPIEPTVVFHHPTTGAGANGDLTIVNGRVDNITITTGGSGYQPVVATATGPTGDANAVFQTVVNTNGVITSIYPLFPGTGYQPGDALLIVHPTGSLAAAEIAMVGPLGEVVSTVVTSGGSGYAPIHTTVTVDSPTGVGFVGTVTVNNSGVITGVTIGSPGIGFVTQSVRVSVNTLTGSGATFSAVVDPVTGAVTAINVLKPGHGYLAVDTITILPPIGSAGTAAAATLTLSPPTTTDSIGYFRVWSGLAKNTIYSNNLKAITDYFKCLGYAIKITTNPLTGATIAWHIDW